MPTTFANTIDGNDIFAKRAECDAAGNDLSTTYATKSELPTIVGLTAGANVTITEGNDGITIAATDTTYSAGTGLSLSGTTFSNADPLPAHTSTESGKVLGVDSNGDLGWVNQSGGGGGGSYSAGTGIDITNDVISVDTSVVATQTDLATKEDAFDVGTGLEMDTSGATPTLQVEAPVDIVAGPGIAIDNPDGNTLRVSTNADSFFKELYYNATNTNDTAGTVYSLSEPITNFMYAKITVDNMEYPNAPLVYEIDVQHNTTSCQWNSPLRNGNVNSTINLPTCQLQINASGNLVLVARGLTYNTYPSPSFTNGNSRGMRVVRVVGIFRIAGGN